MYCVIDTETTGLDPEKHALVQVAFGLKSDLRNKHFDEVAEFKMTYGRYYVDSRALEVNGLTIEDLDKWPDRETSITAMQDWIADKVTMYGKLRPIGHNYKFDEGFLIQVCGVAGYAAQFSRDFLDTKVIALFVDEAKGRTKNSYSLDSLRNYYHISRAGNHEAMKDIRDTAEILRKLMDAL